MTTGTIPMPLDYKVANIDLSKIQEVTGGNLDDLINGGVYFVWQGNGMPDTTAKGNAVVIVLESPHSGGATYLKQIAIRVQTTNTGTIYIRSANTKSTSAWTTWWQLVGTQVS